MGQRKNQPRLAKSRKSKTSTASSTSTATAAAATATTPTATTPVSNIATTSPAESPVPTTTRSPSSDTTLKSTVKSPVKSLDSTSPSPKADPHDTSPLSASPTNTSPLHHPADTPVATNPPLSSSQPPASSHVAHLVRNLEASTAHADPDPAAAAPSQPSKAVTAINNDPTPSPAQPAIVSSTDVSKPVPTSSVPIKPVNVKSEVCDETPTIAVPQNTVDGTKNTSNPVKTESSSPTDLVLPAMMPEEPKPMQQKNLAAKSSVPSVAMIEPVKASTDVKAVEPKDKTSGDKTQKMEQQSPSDTVADVASVKKTDMGNTTTGKSNKTVQLTWKLCAATTVSVAGSFNEWREQVLACNGVKDHSVCLDLPIGKHMYKFIVDGQWCYDVTAPTEMDNDGNVNNVLMV